MITDAHSHVGIVDMGSARTKLTVGHMSPSGVVETTTQNIDIALSEAALERSAERPRDAIKAIISSAVQLLEGKNVSEVLYLGAQAFRAGKYASELTDAIMAETPNFTTLSPDDEARLFYYSVAQEERLNNFVSVDVGGGSVQVSWGPSIGENHSEKLGTYTLEKTFQEDTAYAVGPGDTSWDAMLAAVHTAHSGLLGKVQGRRPMVIGSNIMKDFFVSLAEALESDVEKGTLSKAAMLNALGLMKGKPYSDSYYLFERNHGFMHGADKLLAVCIGLMSALGFDEALGTNASVSKGLCRVLIEKPSELSTIIPQ